MDASLVYARMEMSETWGRTGEFVWVDDGSGTPWLAQIWRCHENGKIDYRPLPMVKVPTPDDGSHKP